MNQSTMDPQDFARRLEAAFDAEPAQGSPLDDLAAGRRRLRRRRLGSSVAVLGAVAVLGGTLGVSAGGVPFTTTQNPVAPASTTDGELTREEVLDRCLAAENVLYDDRGARLDGRAALDVLGAHARLATWSTSARRTVATVVSADGAHWGDCQLGNRPDDGVKSSLSVFSRDVAVRAREVDGVSAYELVEAPALGTTATTTPLFEVTCPAGYDGVNEPEQEARCGQFSLHWNDRRPAEVASVKVVTPDGRASWADVRDGYLSFSYVGAMTEEMAAEVASGRTPGARRIVFYDEGGNVLVDDRHPDREPRPDRLSVHHFPSLAWWRER